jgi:hypothetical protein
MLFTPRNQVRNMLDAEIGQALCGRGDLTKLTALSALMNNSNQGRNNLVIEDNWMDDDDSFWL